MKKRILNSLATLFVLIYWLPTLVQLGHHHEDLFVCQAENEQHFHVKHHQCDICSFQISFFTIDIPLQEASSKCLGDSSISSNTEEVYTPVSSHNFLLRAPPVLV